MLLILVLIVYIAGTYFDSLKRDLSKRGFEVIFLILSITWVGSPLFIFTLLALGKFQMPSDPLFYLYWFGLTLITVVQFTLFIIGMVKARFLAANTFSNLTFVTTTLYAVIFLRESLHVGHIIAILLGVAGAFLFFDWKSVDRKSLSSNAGLLLVLFSVVLAPIESILYKFATLHTSSYHEFLTGRIVMDLIYFSLFFIFLFAFWYKRNPLLQMKSFLVSGTAIIFTVGSIAYHLLDSYFFFTMPVTLLTILGTISIPTGYFIGYIKYKEPISLRYITASIVIIAAVILFVQTGYIE